MAVRHATDCLDGTIVLDQREPWQRAAQCRHASEVGGTGTSVVSERFTGGV